jgi:hypothetical protein
MITIPIGRTARRSSVARDRNGAMLVFIAVSMVALLGFLSLALDVGAGNRERRIAQTAADAGAIAGANEIYRLVYDSVVTSARNEAVRNGYAAANVAVNYPPATGPHAGNNQYVEVIITKNIPTIFGSFFNISSLNVASRAVAGVSSFAENCLVSLDSAGANAVEIGTGGAGGSGQLTTTGCGVAVNSTSPDAIVMNQGGTFDTGDAFISIAGDWSGHKSPTPAPSTGTAQVPNPLSYLQMPTVGACTHTGLLTVSKDTILDPGVYCGGLSITTKTATLNPGTYIMNGGGLTVATSGVILGTGVTLVNTMDATHAYGAFNFGTGCKATLSAPTTGLLPAS